MSDNQPVLSSLLMDRSTPIGNSEGPDGRQRLHTKISNSSTEPIPTYIVDGDPGDPWFLDYSSVLTTNGPVTLLSYTVSLSNTLSISVLNASCRIESEIKILLNSSPIGILRTGAAQPNASFNWNPKRPCVAGDLIEVILTKRTGSPDVLVSANLMGLII